MAAMGGERWIVFSTKEWPNWGYMCVDKPAIRGRIAQLVRQGRKVLGVYGTLEEASQSAAGVYDDLKQVCRRHAGGRGRFCCARCDSEELTERLDRSLDVLSAIDRAVAQ